MLSKRLYKLLVTKFSAIDTKLSSTSGLVTKTKFDSDKEGLQKKIENVYKKIHSTSGLVKKTDYNTKTTDWKQDTQCYWYIVTTASLNTKATETEDKIPDNTDFITAPEFSRLANISFDERKKAERNLATKVQVTDALDLALRNKECLVQVIPQAKVILKMMGVE